MAVVALDLGGVIVDVDHGRCERFLGIDHGTLERAFFDDGLHDDVTVGRVSGIGFAATVAHRLGKNADEVKTAWALVVEVTLAGRAVVEELLARGHRVHLWSNTDPIHMERMRAQLPAGIDEQTASFHLGAMKPHADFFAKARARGEPAIFLDDLDKNVDAADRAGVPVQKCLGPEEARAILSSLGLISS